MRTPIRPLLLITALQLFVTATRGASVMNATDLRMPALVNFNLQKPITDAQGIAVCSDYCANHSTSCGGWVYVSPAFLPRSKYTGPRCSIKAKAKPCYRIPNRPGLFAGTPGSTSCILSPPAPPPGPPQDPYYTHFHVQALKHATADPDGPVWFNSSSDPDGTYHLFAQYDPIAPHPAAGLGSGAYSAMRWYHWTSKDLLRWQHQPVALAPGAKQDCGGIWSGSTTLVHNASTGEVVPMITYSVPCQANINYAVASDPTDANLTSWTKLGTLAKRPEVVTNSSRAMMVDPVPSWQGPDGAWRMIAACNTLRACMWKGPTAMGPFSFVGGFGNTQANLTEDSCFECPDWWKVPQTDTYVLSTMGKGWAVGKYQPNSDISKSDVFVPHDGKNIPQANQKYDYGSQASSAHRSFYDAKHDRQVLWGSTGGALCTKHQDWSGLMAFPRVVQLDPYDSSRLVSFPLPELSTLWSNTTHIATVVEVAAGAKHRLPSGFGGNQLDLHFSFNASADDARTFGIRVLTPPEANSNGGVNVTVSTKPGSAFATLGGGAVATASGPHHPASRTDFLVSGNTIELRILVDHGLVEIFAEGGRSTATAWLCAPSPAEDTGVEVFNNGPATLLVRDALSHQIASVNRLPWE